MAQDGGRLIGSGATSVAISDPAASAMAPDDARLRYGGSYGYGYGQQQQEDGGIAATMRRLLHVVSKRRWLIIGATVGLTTLTLLVTLFQTPRYTATVRLQIDREVGKVVDATDATPSESGQGSQDFLRTQFELLRSRALAERVVVALQLANQPDFAGSGGSIFSALTRLVTPVVDRTTDPVELRRIAADRVQDAVNIRPVPGSRLIDVSYTDPIPTRAQRVANGYGEAFVSANLDKRFEANAYAKTFLEDQIKQLSLRLEEAEKAVVEYAEREQMIETNDNNASLAEQNLSLAQSALGTIIAEKLKAEQLWKQVETSDGMNLPQLLSNQAIDGLRSRRNAVQAEYEEKLETFKPNYPTMVQLTNRLKEIDRQLRVEVEAVRGALKAGYEAAVLQETEMRKRIEALRVEALELQRRNIQYNNLKRDAETTRGLVNSLLQRYKQLDVAAGVGTNNVLIVDRASTPLIPSSPRVGLALAIALVGGLMIGVGIAFVLEAMDDRVKSPEHLEQVTGLTTLGVVPLLPKNTPVMDELADPRSAIAESYRSLATALQFSSQDGLPRSIVLTSAGPSEGKSTSAVALSRHFATMGLKVLLIDAELRRPSLHRSLGLDHATGLCNYLTGAAMPPDVIQATSIPSLAFMASGPLPPNAADLLAGNRMFSLISVGLEVFDLIIIDAPPVLGIADAPLLSSAAQATVFVVAANQSSKSFVRTALRRLGLARAIVVGALLTKFDARDAGYGYGYGYSYGGAYGGTAYGSLEYRAPASDNGLLPSQSRPAGQP
jgi:capsular exopolysaccharide synthesis family protein